MKTTVGLIQMACAADPQQNITRAIHCIEEAASRGAQIILLQELFTTLYFCQTEDERYFDLAEPIPGPLTERLSGIAAENDAVLVLPFFERRAPGLYYNSAAVIDADGSYLGKYQKMHIPDDPGFYEKYYFAPGDLGYRVFPTRYGKVGVLICWDQWYPEAARITALKGADILVYPTAIGTLPYESDEEKERFRDAWTTVQRSHAVANGCYVASVNRVGTEEDLTFWGSSFVAGPFGEFLLQADEREGVFTVECDFGSIERQRRTWPFYRDRRIDSYEDITKRYL